VTADAVEVPHGLTRTHLVQHGQRTESWQNAGSPANSPSFLYGRRRIATGALNRRTKRGLTMKRSAYPLLAAALAVGVTVSACGSPSNSGSTTTGASASSSSQATTSATKSSPPAASGNAAQLPALIPTPANSQQTKGPDNIADNGIHMYFQVNGMPTDVMNAYKAALEGKGWSVSTIMSSGGGGGGGATDTGTHGDAFGVFDGGGYNSTTYIDVCAWPSKPMNPNCTRGGR